MTKKQEKPVAEKEKSVTEEEKPVDYRVKKGCSIYTKKGLLIHPNKVDSSFFASVEDFEKHLKQEQIELIPKACESK